MHVHVSDMIIEEKKFPQRQIIKSLKIREYIATAIKSRRRAILLIFIYNDGSVAKLEREIKPSRIMLNCSIIFNYHELNFKKLSFGDRFKNSLVTHRSAVISRQSLIPTLAWFTLKPETDSCVNKYTVFHAVESPFPHYNPKCQIQQYLYLPGLP